MNALLLISNEKKSKIFFRNGEYRAEMAPVPAQTLTIPPVKVTPWVNAMTGSTLDDNPAPKIPAVVATGTAFVFLLNCHAVCAVRRGAGAIVVVGGGPGSGPPPERREPFGGIWPVSGRNARCGLAD